VSKKFHRLFGLCNKRLQQTVRCRKSSKKEIAVNIWSAFGVFLLGTGAGALLTAIFYSAQVNELRRLLSVHPPDNSGGEPQDNPEITERRKSA